MTAAHPDAVLGAVVFAFGLLFGSFLNVLIHRLPRGESVVFPGSRCPSCGRPIRWFENAPLLSYALLGGRCAGCKARISLRYPLVELIAAAVLWLVFQRFGLTVPFLLYGAYALALVALFWTDFEEWTLPNKITYPGIAAGLVYSFWNPRIASRWPVAFLAAALGYGLLHALDWGYQRLRGEHGMGMGDFKLAAMIGAFSGVEGLLEVLLLASFAGSVVGLGILLFRKGGMKTALPFGCFLAPAAVAVVLFDVGALWTAWQALVLRYLWGTEAP